jgi:hypothetical protein
LFFWLQDKAAQTISAGPSGAIALWVASPARVKIKSRPPIHKTYVLVPGASDSLDEIESSVLAIARCWFISRLPPSQLRQKQVYEIAQSQKRPFQGGRKTTFADYV